MWAADLVPRPLEGQLFGPVAYAPLWLWLGLVLAVVALTWPVVAWWLTRPRPTPVAPRQPAPTPADARAEALAAIARVRRAHAAGALTDRAAHQGLSRAVRRFVAQASGWPVDHMGLADLRAAMGHDPRLAGLTDYVAVLSPPSFGPVGGGDVPRAADRAEDLVGLWAGALVAPADAQPGVGR